MKRLSFLWLLLLANSSVSFAENYLWDCNGRVPDEIAYGGYANTIEHNGIWYFIKNETVASVIYYYDEFQYGKTDDCYERPQNTTLYRQDANYAQMPKGYSTYRCIYQLVEANIPTKVTKEGKTCHVTSIGMKAFADCATLTKVSIPNSVTSIEKSAFYNCISLASVAIPNSVDSIKGSAFADCIALKTATLGNNVKYIGESAFQHCTSLASITIPNSVDSIKGSAFADCIALKTATLGNNVKYIGESAFQHCTSLASIAIPNSVDSIQGYTFQDCTNLTSVTIGNGVEYIGNYAFSGTGLTSITIPDNVKSIDNYAFANCKNLTSITFTSTTPPTRRNSWYHFSGCDNLKVVYIPCGTKEAYEAAGWRNLPLTEPAPDGVVSVETEDNVKGQVKIEDQSTCRNNSTAIISATAQYGYHFTKWNDGNTDNPRTIILTCDTTLTAEFAPNQYTISTEVNDAERGSVSGGTTADYLSEVTLTAIANYGYHFARWQDWNTDNPRTVQVLGDATYSAVFEKNTYTITAQSANDIQGYVYAPYQAEYLDQVSLTAYPHVGYHFTQWTDGNTDNPREIVLTCDTTFTAEFAQTFSGQCGYDLYWKYEGHTLTISGTGNMYDYNENDMPWLLFRDTTDVVILERGITHIGNNAFNGFVKLGKIELPSTLTSIGANAFAGCRKLYDIYSYAVEPPVADNTSFANYNVYLHVPCDNLRDYQMDAVFGSFKYIQCIGAENTTTDGTVTVTPSDNEAVFVWRADESAASYNLEIRKDGEVFCTLIFNANGQLTSIAFAPARNRQTHRAAEQTAAGFRFTVTGLSESTRYTFGMTVKDAANATLQTYTGEFNTTGVATDVDNATTDTVVQKIIRDGQVLILRGDKTYTVMGVEVNE